MSYCLRLTAVLMLFSQPLWASDIEVPLHPMGGMSSGLALDYFGDDVPQTASPEWKAKIQSAWRAFSAYMIKVIVDPCE